jgi:hypothetical protein
MTHYLPRPSLAIRSLAGLVSTSHAQRQAVFYKFTRSQKSHYAERRSFGSEDVQMRCGVYGQCHSNEVWKMRREESETEMKVGLNTAKCANGSPSRTFSFRAFKPFPL